MMAVSVAGRVLCTVVTACTLASALVTVDAFAQPAHQAPAAPQTALRGVWEATRVNGQPLPMTDRVVGTDGFTHAILLAGMTIRLHPNGRFQAALQYRRAILTRGERIESAKLETDTWIGTYTITGSHMRFVPEKRGAQKVQPFEGERAGRRITVGFDYDIVTRKRYALELTLNDAIW